MNNISKEEARQIITRWLVSSKGAIGQCGYIEGWFDDNDEEAFRMAIEALTAEPVHGEWIKHEKSKGVFSRECSVCGCWFSWDGMPRNSYCPNCGAKMTGDDLE